MHTYQRAGGTHVHLKACQVLQVGSLHARDDAAIDLAVDCQQYWLWRRLRRRGVIRMLTYHLCVEIASHTKKPASRQKFSNKGESMEEVLQGQVDGAVASRVRGRGHCADSLPQGRRRPAHRAAGRCAEFVPAAWGPPAVSREPPPPFPLFLIHHAAMIVGHSETRTE